MERKIRSIVMLLSILLSTVLLFVSFSIGTSYEHAQRKMAYGMAGHATISVCAKNTEDIVNIQDIPESSSIQTSVGILKANALYKEHGYYETMDLLAADLTLLNQINPPRLVSGEGMKEMSGNQIILPDRFTNKYKIVKGDIITLHVNSIPMEFEVADIAAYDTVFLRHTRGTTALLPQAALAKILEKETGYSEILIEPAAGVSSDVLVHTLANELSERYQVTTIVNEAQITADARQKSMPFFLISFFSLTMSIFIIYSSYKVIILDRLPIIGTFRSIGATKKTLICILMLESLFYGCVGGIAGIPLGIGVLNFILQGMGNTLSQGIEIPIVITGSAVFLSFAVALIVSTLSAWIPVRRASRIPIKSVVLGVVEDKNIPNNVVALLGITLLLISILLPKIASSNMMYLFGGCSLLGFIIATLMVIPLLTNLSSKCLEYVSTVIGKNEGVIASKNIRNNKNITQNITLLFISISAIIAITVVGNFVNTYITDVFHGAELEGFADGEMSPEFIQQVKTMEGIEKVLPVYVLNNDIRNDAISFSRVEATDNLAWYNSLLNLHYSNQDMENNAIAEFSKSRSVILSEDCLSRTNYKIGDMVTLENMNGRNSYMLVGSFKSRATDVEAIIPSIYAISDFHVQNYNFLAYTASDPDAIMLQIRDLFGNTQNWSRTVEEFNTDALSTVGAFLKPMHSMTYFILLLAAVGIMNNLLINYIQKRRTIAMYKSVGMSNKQNMKITIIESCTAGIIGTLIAIIISYLEIQTIFLVAGPKISMLPDLDVSTFLSSAIMGILITLIGSVVPIIKSRNMKIVEEIKFE